MTARLLSAAVVMMLSATSAFAFGTIFMSSTSYPDSIVVEVSVDDDGSLGSCAWLAVTRNGADVHYFERQIGGNYTARYVDTDIQPSTSYCYQMALRTVPGEVPCFVGDLCEAFDCFCAIETCANPGPDPVFIGQGYLKTTFPDGSPIDNNEATALLYECTSTTEFIALHRIPLDAQPYLDSDTAVDVSGDFECCWAQCVWLLSATLVTPSPCPLPVEATTWGRVKALYRE